MDYNITSAIFGLIAGAISGTVASLTAPWIHWKIEKKKIKLENRRKKLEQWRNYINRSFDPQFFRETVEFSEMKNFLSKKIVKELDPPDLRDGRPVINLRGAIGRDNIRDRLLEEVAVIEREWGLL